MKKIPLFKPFISKDVFNFVNKVLKSDWIGTGPQTAKFEKSLSNYLNQKNLICVNSCTSAIQLALTLTNVGAGDEVITTPMTCVATNMPILLKNAIPVWADINPKSGNIDPKSIEKKITKNTKAILIVDWGGLPCDYEEIINISNKYGLPIIEDAAHALGSVYDNEKVGSHSDFVCFSLQAVKTITTGDGGFIVCKNESDFNKSKKLIWYGIGRDYRNLEYDINYAGNKFTMNDIAASIGLAQMPYLDNILKKRQLIATKYNQLLKGVDGIQIIESHPLKKSSYWLYTLLVKERDKFIKLLNNHGVEASIVHRRNDLFSVFRPFKSSELHGLNEFANKMVCIPIGHWINEDDIYYITNIINKGW